MDRTTLPLSILFGLALGCGASVAPHDTPPDAGADVVLQPPHDAGLPDVSSPGDDGNAHADAGFVTAQHEPFPELPNQGGPRLDHVKLVTIAYPGFAHEAWSKSFGDFIVTSSWLTTVGADFGVSSGTHSHVLLTDPAPSAVATSDTVSYLTSKIKDGTLPGGLETTPSEYLYMIFYPPQTVMTDLAPGLSCADTMDQGGAAWHDSVDQPGSSFAYAVIPTCSKQSIESIEIAASHELIEAATDAYPLTTPAYQFPATSPWQFLAEVGDLCEFLGPAYEGGHALTRVWSNTAAGMNVDPCIPAQAMPYGNVSVSPDTLHTVMAGGSITLPVTGWSTGPMSDWQLQAYPTGQGQAPPTAQLGSTTMNNGAMTTLTIGNPPGTPSGTTSWVLLLSMTGQTPISAWPVGIRTP